MAVTIQCPNVRCATVSAVAEALHGRRVRCRKCGTPFTAVPTIDGELAETRRSGPSISAQPFATLPAEFGRYRVFGKLGQGGMGAVYLAEDTHLGRQVALKLPSFPTHDTRRIERFVREARSSAVLQHPNICTVFDAGEIDGRPFISMAYVNGQSLEDLVDPDVPIPPARIAELVRKIALALAHAHARGIIHRDLKPANVMLTREGEPVVMDFGLAKRVADIDPNETKLTHDGAVMGTPGYMAPELVRGELLQIGPATDVYALGVILFEMLTGQTPYSGPVGVVLSQILTAPVPLATDVRATADPRLTAICYRAMAKDPAWRYPEMTAFAIALAEYQQGVPTVTVVPFRPPAVTTDAPFDVLSADDPPAVRLSRAYQRRSRSRMPPLLLAVALIAVFAALAVFTPRTKFGDVIIEFNNPSLAVDVAIDGNRVDASGPDKNITLTAGEHKLAISGAEIEPVVQPIVVKRGETNVVRVALKRKAVVTKPEIKPEAMKAPVAVEPRPVPAERAVPMFSGKDLTGWDYTGNFWSVTGGVVVGQPSSDILTDRFLCSQKSYIDFELKFQVLLKNGVGNSGVQVRGRIVNPADLTVAGPQVQIDATQYGGIYGERMNGQWLKRLSETEVKRVFKPNDFNDYTIRCVGKRMTVIINGNVIADEEFPQIEDSGIIAFYLNGVLKAEEVMIRNVTIEDLSRKAVAEPAFGPLFNGKNLSGWKMTEPAKWVWMENRLLGSGFALLVSESEYDNYELTLDYRLATGGECHLLLRMLPLAPKIDRDFKSMAVQMLDDAEYPTQASIYNNGSIYNEIPRRASVQTG